MTVVHLKSTPSKRTNTMLRGAIPTRRPSRFFYRTPHSSRNEILFGLAVTGAILGLASLAAFNGGVSVEAAGLQMTVDASTQTGLHVSFVTA